MTHLKFKKNSLCIKLFFAASSFLFLGCGEQHSEKFNSLPENYKTIDCAGGIETINAKRISSTTSVEDNENLVINGWAVLNTNEGLPFDKVQISITDARDNIVRYSTFKTKRDDVSTYFKQGLDDSGFTTFIPSSSIKGIVILNVIGIKGQQYYLCKNLQQRTNIH